MVGTELEQSGFPPSTSTSQVKLACTVRARVHLSAKDRAGQEQAKSRPGAGVPYSGGSDAADVVSRKCRYGVV